MHALNDRSKHNIQPTGFSTMGFFFLLLVSQFNLLFSSVSISIKNVQTEYDGANIYLFQKYFYAWNTINKAFGVLFCVPFFKICTRSRCKGFCVKGDNSTFILFFLGGGIEGVK